MSDKKKHVYKANVRKRKYDPIKIIEICILLAAVALLGMAAKLFFQEENAAQVQPVYTPVPTPQFTAVPTPAPTAVPATPVPSVSPLPFPSEQPDAGTAFQQTALNELEAFVAAQEGHVSVWLLDINTGETYYHQNGGFYCASTLKAPYALWLCQQDEAGMIDLDTEFEGGTGWEQIHTMISRSSNGAARRLSEKWPGNLETGFQEFLLQMGFSSPNTCEVVSEGIHGWTTAQDGGLAMKAVYSYIQSGSENAKKLEQAFLAADHDLLWLPAPAAKKYGSWEHAFHDMAIVYGDKPYILSVFTDWGNKEENFPEAAVALMQQIGKLAARAEGIAE